MKLEVKVLLDTESASDMEALVALIGYKPEVKTSPAPAKKAPAQKAEPEADCPAPPAEPAPVPREPEPTPVEEKPEPQITVQMIRTEVSLRVAKHREALTAKLRELGAPNVTQLSTDKYGEFYNYVTSLQV